MSRICVLVLVFLCLAPHLHARKLLAEEKDSTFLGNLGKNALLEHRVPPSAPTTEERSLGMERVSPLDRSLFFSALPKGVPVPPSTPSNKNHAVINNERLFAERLSRMERFLKSVPSPGVGH